MKSVKIHKQSYYFQLNKSGIYAQISLLPILFPVNTLYSLLFANKQLCGL